MDSREVVNQEKALEDGDEQKENLRERRESPSPKHPDTNEDDPPFDRRYDIRVVLGIPVRDGAEVTVAAEWQKMPMGKVRMDWQIL